MLAKSLRNGEGSASERQLGADSPRLPLIGPHGW